MNIANVYEKSLTFFSRSRQEKIVSYIEREFYESVTVYEKDPHSLAQLHLKLEKICGEIRYHTSHSYFEDDLLEYMFNLLSFVANYMEDLKANAAERSGGTEKRQMAKGALFCG